MSKTFIKGFKLLKLFYPSCQVKMLKLCSSLQYFSYNWQGRFEPTVVVTWQQGRVNIIAQQNEHQRQQLFCHQNDETDLVKGVRP